MRTRSVRPSPDMSARKIVSVRVGEDEPGPLLFVRGHPHGARAGRSRLRPATGTSEMTSSSVIRTSAWPSPVRSTKRRLGSLQSRLGWLANGVNGTSRPARRVRRIRRRPIECHEVELAVAGEVEELGATLESDGRFLRDELLRPESAFAEIRLVPPGAGLFGEDAREPFAVQVEPLVLDAVGAGGKIGEALLVERACFLADVRTGVGELERRHRLAKPLSA